MGLLRFAYLTRTVQANALFVHMNASKNALKFQIGIAVIAALTCSFLASFVTFFCCISIVPKHLLLELSTKLQNLNARTSFTL